VRGYYQPLFLRRWLPIRSILPICLLFASFLVLVSPILPSPSTTSTPRSATSPLRLTDALTHAQGNLSLTFNTVSFYQLANILTVPTVVLFNFLLFRKTISLQKLAAVGIACLGVVIATGASVRANLLGTCLAVAAFCCTALYQISIGRMLAAPIDEVVVSAPQLLMNQTLVSSAMLLVLVPVFDTRPVLGTCSFCLASLRLVSCAFCDILKVCMGLLLTRHSSRRHTHTRPRNLAGQRPCRCRDQFDAIPHHRINVCADV